MFVTTRKLAWENSWYLVPPPLVSWQKNILGIKRFSYDLEMKMRKTKQKEQTNTNKAIWLVYQSDINTHGFWLVKRTLGWKNFMSKNFLVSIDTVLWHHTATRLANWTICLLYIRVFLAGKTKSPCFDLFIHWLIKQITNTYQNHFSRSYKNHSNCRNSILMMFTTQIG